MNFSILQGAKVKKEIWEMLEVTHEGIADVRRERKQTLVSKYEAFRMQNSEPILELQTRFTHIVNHLLDIGKMFEYDELNITILNYLQELGNQKSQ